jgi:hypothetical protein
VILKRTVTLAFSRPRVIARANPVGMMDTLVGILDAQQPGQLRPRATHWSINMAIESYQNLIIGKT